MKTAGGGFDQCFNGQIAVDMDSILIVTTNTVQVCNDKQQIAPTLEQIKALQVELGKPVNVMADAGYFFVANVKACAEQKISPLIAVCCEGHHPGPMARFAE